MCDKINSEDILKSYFSKHTGKNTLSYKDLNTIRQKVETEIGAYIDVSYSSLRSVETKYPNDVIMDNQQIQLINREVFLSCPYEQDDELNNRLQILL